MFQGIYFPERSKKLSFTVKKERYANPAAFNSKPSYAVVLKMPKSVDNPDACKQFLDNLTQRK